ncbi:hypothetical protein HDU67_002413 [Dinochytrium kinnereticum]|nr:hypothetical protein HDU67_002413 [Dinochytrium kinnereticum]
MEDAGIIITVRLIKSFEYRTTKNLVLHGIHTQQMTVGQLKALIRERISTDSSFKAYRNVDLDTMKMYFKTHGTKSQNLIINIEHEDKYLEDDTTLADAGLENETEISFFNLAAYMEYKLHPETKW